MKKMLVLLFSLIVVNVFGEFHFTPPPPPMPMNQFNYNAIPYHDPVYRCEVFLTDGTMIEGKSSLYKDIEGEFHLKIDKEIYTPANTDSIHVNQCLGIPKEDYWLFKTVSGKLSIFNKYPENNLDKNAFISKTEDILIPYSKTSLFTQIRDNPDALSMYNKINSTNKAGNVLAWGGLGVIVVSFLSLPHGGTDKDFSELPQFRYMIGGGILSFIGYIVKQTNKNTYFDVVKKYNK